MPDEPIIPLDILAAVDGELAYQETRWGTEVDDTKNVPNDFVAYIGAYATKWFPGGFTPYTPQTVDEFRESMIKTAAIAIAAIKSVDRQRINNGTTFYEEN